VLKKEPNAQVLDMGKDPYILDFLGLKQNDDLLESDLEKRFIAHVQKFLPELERGFAFDSRQ
jgi:predicted nuclease of restriction endonuclease-like (RecB) superfamily